MFLNVLTQVLILLILIMLGAVLTKAKMLNSDAIKGMTDLVLYIVTPCVIINSFKREFDSSLTKSLLISLLIAFLAHFGYIILSHLCLHSRNKAQEKVLRFGTVFANCGFMAIPLLSALVGDLGVFFGTSFVAVFNILVWSYGVVLMSGDKKALTPKKLILNPGIIGSVLGLVVFFTNIHDKIPTVISEPISFMAALNTPLPMIIIGYHLANSNLLESIKNLKVIFSMVLRLLIFPALVLGVMYLCGIRGEVLVACTISASVPTAANTTMFSSKFGADTALSVSMVSLSTILSLITIPIIVTIAKIIA